MLEARDRVGGRAHTIMASPDVTFDVGCGWLHSADQNSFVQIAEQLNFDINKSLPPWRERAYGKAFPQDDRDDFMRAMNAFYDRAEQAAQEAERSGRDSAASLYLEPGNRWNPMIDAISTYINGCELDQVSILDMDAYEDTDLNWRIRRGYGAMIAAYGASCPLALNCMGTLSDHSQNASHRDLSFTRRRQGNRPQSDQPDRRRGHPLYPPAGKSSRRGLRSARDK